MHKKRHKIDEALICPYCQRSYVDQHRYAVHVRFHTGETPFHCDLCGKGFRDDRKMKLHMARHNSGLSHKCHLCPRSFEGPKALEKHLNAHATGRYVAPKVIQKSDGTTAMALPDDKPKELVGALSGPSLETWSKSSELGETDVLSSSPSPLPVAAEILPDVSAGGCELAAEDVKLDSGIKEEEEVPSSVISLSVDDLYQYSVTQSGIDLPG
jgi:Zinc finger, C2H2 type